MKLLRPSSLKKLPYQLGADVTYDICGRCPLATVHPCRPLAVLLYWLLLVPGLLVYRVLYVC